MHLFCDESGNTGVELLDPEQPVFALYPQEATWFAPDGSHKRKDGLPSPQLAANEQLHVGGQEANGASIEVQVCVQAMNKRSRKSIQVSHLEANLPFCIGK